MNFLKIIITTLLITISVSGAAFAISKDLKAGDTDPESGKVLKYWVAPMDPTYIRDEFGQSPMGMDLVPVFKESGEEKEPTSDIRIDPVTLQNMGVRLGKVAEKPVEKNLRVYGTVTYDETRRFRVNLKYSGWVEKVYNNYSGISVKQGEPLFDIYSPELVKAQEEYLLAYNQLRLAKKRSNAGSVKSAEALYKAAEKRLLRWDVKKSQMNEILKKNRVEKSFTIHSPVSGVVIEKKIIEGDFITPGKWQYEITDLSKVWVEARVYEYELQWIYRGMKVNMDLSYIPGRVFTGEVMTVDPFVDPKTRTVRMRISFDNSDFALKPQMYANLSIASRIEDKGLIIPQEAVIDSGVRKIAFLAKGKGRFEPREIVVGQEVNGGSFHLLQGLEKGDEVVISAQFMFDSESRLREAINKLLEAKSGKPEEDTEFDDLDFEGMEMGEMDMDMPGTIETEN